MNPTIDIDSTPYEVLQTFGFNRCLIRYDGGTCVLADRGPITGAWALSAIPATPEENKVIQAFMPTDEVDTIPE
jgi:hypothetical protein